MNDKIALLEKAIKNKSTLKITYLKPNDEKSVRNIQPEGVWEMTYQGKTYLGVRAFCLMRREVRTVRVDRILEMEEN